jgi:hypothetical protein
MPRQPRTNAPAAKGGRSLTEAAGAKADKGRWSSARKTDVVLRLLKGEDLDSLSRELGVSTARIAEWRDDFLAGGQASLQSREPDRRDTLIHDLKAKLGDQTMTIELLERKIGHLEDGLRPPSRRHST